MNIQFYIQDPSNNSTKYLYEAIVEQLMKEQVISWEGIYAFASRSAVQNILIDDPTVSKFIKRASSELIVGTDAITDDNTLTLLKILSDKLKFFNAKVFSNNNSCLFHPKISRFKYSDGSTTFIVGSGNFTSAGLKRNFEAYTVIKLDQIDNQSNINWDSFIEGHKNNILPIDDTLIEKAKRNRFNARAIRKEFRDIKTEESSLESDADENIKDMGELKAESVLIAYVPAAGNRWHQVHYNKAIISKFFKVSPDEIIGGTSKRVFLREVKSNGKLSEEEIRPFVYSKRNQNFKIEVASHRGKSYPKEGKPVIILRELGTRNYLYSIILPYEQGYTQVKEFLEKKESTGLGLKRIITTISDIRTTDINLKIFTK